MFNPRACCQCCNEPENGHVSSFGRGTCNRGNSPVSTDEHAGSLCRYCDHCTMVNDSASEEDEAREEAELNADYERRTFNTFSSWDGPCFGDYTTWDGPIDDDPW